MNILIVGKNQKALYTMQSLLEDDGYTVYSTASTLQALEMIKSITMAAIVCEYQMQIIDALKFPRWISLETGVLPPYFIISEDLTEDDIKNHENAQMITGVYRNPREMEQLKITLGRHIHH